MLYNIERKGNSEIYTFHDIDLKIKTVEINDKTNVYINYNGFNPLFAMLLGDFEAECELDSISFDVNKEILRNDNTMYAVIIKIT